MGFNQGTSVSRGVPEKKLLENQTIGMTIVKQAILKSFIEASVILERTPESEKLVMDWVKFVYKNGKEEWEAVNQADDEPFN